MRKRLCHNLLVLTKVLHINICRTVRHEKMVLAIAESRVIFTQVLGSPGSTNLLIAMKKETNKGSEHLLRRPRSMRTGSCLTQRKTGGDGRTPLYQLCDKLSKSLVSLQGYLGEYILPSVRKDLYSQFADS